MSLSFHSFFTAVHDRMTGFLLSGVFRRFETSQAIADASLQAELETKIRSLQEDGNAVAAKRLESELGRIHSSQGAGGVAFANDLLADCYEANSFGSDADCLPGTDSSNGNLPTTKKRGRKKNVRIK